MSQSDKLEDCKKEIRSILISYQKGCLLSEFNRAYSELIGRRLPIREFGFRADIEFLYSIPDVVRILPTRSGEYQLTAVPDEKSIHIQKMVAKQKPAKSKPSARFSKPSRSSNFFPPRFAELYSKHYEPISREIRKPPGPKSQPKLELKLPPKSVPKQLKISPREELKLPPKTSPKEEVIALVQYFDNLIAFDDLLSEYQRKYEKSLSLAKYGFSSLEECIEDIPELSIENINKCTFVLYHPKSSAASDTNKNYSVQDTSVLSSENEDHQSYALDPINRSSQVPSSFQSEMSKNQNDDNVNVTDSFKKKLQMVAEKYVKGILSSEFPSCFEEVTGVAFDLYSLGYRCLSDLIDDVPDIFTRERLAGSKKDYVIYSVKKSGSELNESVASTDYCTLSGTKVINHVIVNLRRILQAYPEGITLQDFLHIYSINCKDTLCIKDFGFDDLETFLTSIKNQVPLNISSSKGMKTVHMLHDSDSSSCIKLPETSQKEIIPFDAVHPGFKFKPQTLPNNFDFSKFIPVYTSSVAHPGHLYIQLQGEQTTDALVKLGENIETFYNGSKSTLYIMKNIHIKVGASCVAQWPADGHWYRAEIISISSMETVQVHYVDYGTRETIPITLLRYIKKEFVNLPAQALRCCLAFLKPAKNATKWNVESRSRILSLCEDVSLMAKVQEIRPDGIYSILLCDTNGEDDVYINDVLCNEGLVDYDVGNDVNDSSVVSPPVMPVESHHNLNPLQALQAQYFLQAFVTVAPSFAHNENYIKLMREVTMCCSNTEQGMQNINMSSSSAFVPPGFKAVLSNVPAHQNSTISSGTHNMLSLASASKPGIQSQLNIQNPPGLLTSSTDSETLASVKSAALSTEENVEAQCEIFDDDDDDEIFQEFCQKLSRARHVKRVLLGEGYKIHIIVFESKPYASSGDISQLIWSNKEADYLFRRMQLKDVDIPSLTLSKAGNEELFQQLEKFCVKGIKKMTGCIPSILLYPLRVVIKILNIFGHPSVALRTKLTEEIASFDPDDPEWMSFASPEPLESQDGENLSGVTDDDKIEKLCLFDLLAIKESVTLRRKKMNSMNNLGNNIKNDERDKLEQLHQKVLQRIQEIKEICSVFS